VVHCPISGRHVTKYAFDVTIYRQGAPTPVRVSYGAKIGLTPRISLIQQEKIISIPLPH